jgi:2-keto-3-deoxy-L-rhamnonate aldolase RhmA
LHINGKEFVEKANQETVVLAHVETRASVTNIRQILGNAGVDIVFLGMYDLTVSYGYPGEFKHANATAAVEEIIAAAREYEKVVGMWVPAYRTAEPWINRGVRFFERPSDVRNQSIGTATRRN